MSKRMVDVDVLVRALRAAGLEAGIGISGSSSYPLIQLAGGFEIWAYIPNNQKSNVSLGLKEALKKIK